jgi:DNA-binding response OmpR family regulator
MKVMGHETTKVLVVDDDMRLRSLLERYLVEQGFIVRTAANSEQMDRLLERENFHLIVLDLMLPGEDGLSICRRLRQKENDIPIVKMSHGDKTMSLTSGEFAVLKALVTHPREPLSRDKLMNLARGRDYSALERSIDVQVSRLRRMIEVDAANPRYIQTVWGLGYVFVPDGEK